MDKNKEYVVFASNLSFFEFNQDEFYEPKFKIENYKTELELIKHIKLISQENLSELISKNPKIFDIFEQTFQLKRFSNTQLINFLFDVQILNSTDNEKIIEYLDILLKNNHFNFIFQKIKNKQILDSSNSKNIDELLLIKLFKESLVQFVENAIKDKELIYERLKDKSVSLRFTKYLINNLKLEDTLESINLSLFLKNKRIGKDSKSIHGKFGTIKIKKIMKELDMSDITNELNKLNVKILNEETFNNSEFKKYHNQWIFLTEKYVDGIFKTKQKKLKKFDFVVLYDLKIKYLIETNFYSTTGTKIGINEEEYIDLNEEIKKSKKFTFFWITDGNFWLTSEGESMFKRDLDYFGENLLNYNLFKLKMKHQINNF